MTTPFGAHHPLTRRVDDLLAKKLSTNEIVILVQEIVEDKLVIDPIRFWGPNVYDIVVHYVNQRLCTLTAPYAQ